MNLTIDLNKKQYFDLHEGKSSRSLNYEIKNEFVIESVGETDEKNYQNIGIEYHRYVV